MDTRIRLHVIGNVLRFEDEWVQLVVEALWLELPPGEAQLLLSVGVLDIARLMNRFDEGNVPECFPCGR